MSMRATPESARNNAQIVQYVARHFRNLKRFATVAAAEGDGLMTVVSP
jgi:hypothetical protein